MTNNDSVKSVEDYLLATIEQVLLGYGGDDATEEDIEDTKLLSEMVSSLVINALDLHIVESDGENMTATLKIRQDDEWMDNWADAIEERLGPL